MAPRLTCRTRGGDRSFGRELSDISVWLSGSRSYRRPERSRRHAPVEHGTPGPQYAASRRARPSAVRQHGRVTVGAVLRLLQPRPLDGRVVVLTGATAGIGRETALRLASA